jgi:undecaprenyl diphosphate synthase
LPPYVRAPLVELMSASAENRDMVLCLALSYGGREMLTKAVREMCRASVAGRLEPNDITVETVESYLDSARILPPLDLLIRTSGEHRISNFFLWETAYAELHFTEKMWPEFDRDDLMIALQDFASRERRFGQTSEQVTRPTVTGEGDSGLD